MVVARKFPAGSPEGAADRSPQRKLWEIAHTAMRKPREGRYTRPNNKDACLFASSSAEFRVARMEPPLRLKLYTPGNRLDNPK